jgi:acyl dehydratase
LFFEEFNVGDEFRTGSKVITEEDVRKFAELSGDLNPLHVDPEYAKRGPYGALIAHGLLVLAQATGLSRGLGHFESTTLGFLGIEAWKFVRPVRIGEGIHVSMRITEKRDTSKPDRGVLKRQFTILNEHEETVQDGIFVTMVRKRQLSRG